MSALIPGSSSALRIDSSDGPAAEVLVLLIIVLLDEERFLLVLLLFVVHLNLQVNFIKLNLVTKKSI